MNQQISAISEQGDLGLWNTELNESDQKSYQESLNLNNMTNTPISHTNDENATNK